MTRNRQSFGMAVTALLTFAAAYVTAAESQSVDDKAELAKKTLNPVAAMISVPIQVNYDSRVGPYDDGRVWRTNVQPVVPVSLNESWNLISRTIVPIVSQEGILSGHVKTPPYPRAASEAADDLDTWGLGDTLQSFFFSPVKPTAGWIWGVGPVLYLATATDSALGAEKWGAGPTAVLLRQEHGFTYGVLVNHVWSVAGNRQRDDVNASYLQPFLSYTLKTYTSFSVNTESSYNWLAEGGNRWSVPVNFAISQLLKVGGLPLSVLVGARYWAESPKMGGQEYNKGWGYRAQLQFLFPR